MFSVSGRGGLILGARFFFDFDRSAERDDRCAMVRSKEGVRVALEGEGGSGVVTAQDSNVSAHYFIQSISSCEAG